MTYITCYCQRFSPTCYICVGKAKAFKAGQRAAHRGLARTCGPQDPFIAYEWQDGWRSTSKSRQLAREKKQGLISDIKAAKSALRDAKGTIKRLTRRLARMEAAT